MTRRTPAPSRSKTYVPTRCPTTSDIISAGPAAAGPQSTCIPVYAHNRPPYTPRRYPFQPSPELPAAPSPAKFHQRQSITSTQIYCPPPDLDPPRQTPGDQCPHHGHPKYRRRDLARICSVRRCCPTPEGPLEYPPTGITRVLPRVHSITH